MFDIITQDFSKAAEIGYKFELNLPTGAPSGAYLTVLGDNAPTVKAYSRRLWVAWRFVVRTVLSF